MPCVSTEMSSAKRQASAELEPPVSRFLDFVEALTVRFKQLWVSSAVPLRRGAKMMCESKDWHERSICHFCQLLDRSSLVFYRSMYCSSQGARSLRDCRTDFINVVASCALACDAEAVPSCCRFHAAACHRYFLRGLRKYRGLAFGFRIRVRCYISSHQSGTARNATKKSPGVIF